MPITITLPTPGALVAPYGGFQAQSDFIGPLPTGTVWRFLVSPDPEPAHFTSTLEMQLLATASSIGTTFQPLGTDSRNTWRSQEIVADGTTMHVTAQLVQPGEVVIDSGATTGPWQSTAAFQLAPTTTVTGGFTETDREVVNLTAQGTVPNQLLDALTLVELTSGPSAGPVSSALPSFAFGVIIRLATVPESIHPQTPDGDYWVPTLAVMRLFRGSDLWMRVPVHTSSKIIPFFGDVFLVAVTALTPTQWLLDMSVQVTFLPGVTGEVFLMRFP